MRREINLLETSETATGLYDEKQRRSVRMVILLLLTFGLFVLAVFSYRFYLEGKRGELASITLAKEEEIEKMRDREGLYRVAKHKLKAIEEIIKKRPDLVPVLDLLENTTPEGISFETILVPVEDKISLIGKAANSSVLKEFFSSLTEKEFKKYFRQVTLNSLTFSKGKGYNFDLLLLLTLKEKK